MMLSELIPPGRALVDVEARSKKHALEILSELLASALPAPEGEIDLPADTNVVMSSLVHREKLGCTGLGGGVALPHGTVPGMGGCAGACIRLTAPIEYDTSDGDPVDILVGIIVGDPVTQNDKEILDSMTMMLTSPDCLSKLRRAKDSVQLHESLHCLDENRELANSE